MTPLYRKPLGTMGLRRKRRNIVPFLVLLIAAAVIGSLIWQSRGITNAALAPLLLLAASAVFVSLVFFPQERFRIPVIDPTMIVCASALGAGTRFER